MRKIAIIIITVAGILFLWRYGTIENQNNNNQPFTTDSSTERNTVPPVAQFRSRITKKPFGIYITKTNSPVSPERFSGWHTGADAEYEDVLTEVEVAAIADGIVETAGWVSGYGGVVVIRHQIESKTLYAIYGHLRGNSMPAAGDRVLQGQVIGYLGAGNSRETDGERRHLHFGLAKTNTLAGYAASQPELNAGWVDPLLIIDTD